MVSSSWLVSIRQLPFLLGCILLSGNFSSWRLENRVKVEDLVDKLSFVWVKYKRRIFCRDALHLQFKKQQKHIRRLVCTVIIRPPLYCSFCCWHNSISRVQHNWWYSFKFECLNFKHEIFMHLMKQQAPWLVQKACVFFFALQITRRTYTEECFLMKVK